VRARCTSRAWNIHVRPWVQPVRLFPLAARTGCGFGSQSLPSPAGDRRSWGPRRLRLAGLLGESLRFVRMPASVALVRNRSFLRLATAVSETMRCFGSRSLISPAGGRPTRDAQELRRATSKSELVRARTAQRTLQVGVVVVRRRSRALLQLRAKGLWRRPGLPLGNAVSAVRAAPLPAPPAPFGQKRATRWTSLRELRNRTKEPPGLPSAEGEVELPHSRARAPRPPRDRELQVDAGRPHAPHGTHQALDAPPLYVATRPGVFPSVRAPGPARRRLRPAAPDVGVPTAALAVLDS